MTINFCNDPHMNLLYLKWSAEEFHKGNRSEGMDFFRLACNRSIENEQAVYSRMWTVIGYRGTDAEFGKQAFHDLDGYSSHLNQKTQAIHLVLADADKNELGMRETQVLKCLSILQRTSRFSALLLDTHTFTPTVKLPSNFSERLRAVQMYADKSRVLTWLIDKKQVHLIKREDGNLECLVADPYDRTLDCMSIDLNGQSREDAISFLSECNVTLTHDTPVFSKPKVFEHWPSIDFIRENRELQLLIKDASLSNLLCTKPCIYWLTPKHFMTEDHFEQIFRDGLLWRFYDRTNRVISCAPINNVMNVTDAIRNMEMIRIHENKSCLYDFDIHLYTDAIPRLFSVSIEKKVFVSHLDASQTIDLSRWAITLLETGRSHNTTDITGWIGHAMIAYEGVENGMPFLRYAHLIATKCSYFEVKIEDAKDTYIGFISKSPTWIRSRCSVNQMVNLIKEEVEKAMPFEFVGNDLKHPFKWLATDQTSKISSNYLTWIIKKFSFAGIELPEPSFFPFPNEYIRMINSNPSLVKFTQSKSE